MLKFKPQQTRKYYITASFILSLGFSLFFHETVHAEESYNDPKGRLVIRNFDLNGKAPKKNIIVCTDRPDVEIPRLQRFVDYVLADKGYVIIDGREENIDVSLTHTTLVYVGHYKKTDEAKSCLDKFPELNRFLIEGIKNEKIRDPFSDIDDSDPFKRWQMARMEPLACALASNRHAKATASPQINFFLLRFLDDSEMHLGQFENCNWSYVLTLFSIEDIQCEHEQICKNLVEEVLDLRNIPGETTNE